MDKILLVEDATFFGSIIKRKLARDMEIETVWATSYAQAAEVLAQQEGFCLALLDLSLPDADGTDIVQLVRGYHIPSIVFSRTYERSLRDEVLRLGVVDYVIKENQASLSYLFSSVNRLLLNRERSVLVVEDSASTRHNLVSILQRFQLNVIAVENGTEAMAQFMKHPEISLVITDYHIPEINGLELTRMLQREVSQRNFAIIGLSAAQDSDVRIQFIKAGANDFLHKPFEVEELFCRISQNLDYLDQFERLHRQANNDFLTGLYNRRYFFESSKSKMAQAQRSGELCAVMIIDIDNFKSVNDTYGHESGDRVLIGVADTLASKTRHSDMLARLGGEEFCKLIVSSQSSTLANIALDMLTEIGEQRCKIVEGEISVTISIGVAYSATAGLEELMDYADTLLYQAKNGGRNRAVIGEAYSTQLEPQIVQGPIGIEKPYIKEHPKLVQDWR